MPGLTAKPTTRPRAYGRHGLAAFLAAMVLAVSGFQLNEERLRLDLLRDRIDTLWSDLEQDLQAKAALATELVEVVDRERPSVHGKDFVAARNSVAGCSQELGRASDRAEAVEANLSLDRALRRFMDSLAGESMRLSGSRASPGVRRAQENILAAEHRVALHRTAYNEAVQHFNTHLALFPANFAGTLFGIKRYPYYMPTNLRDIVQLPPTPVPVPRAEEVKSGK